MKMAKILSAAAAAAVAVSAVAVSASAALSVPDDVATGLNATSGMYEFFLYQKSDDGTVLVDRGVDVTSIASISVTITPAEQEWWDGMTGGSIFISCGPTSGTPEDHNWVQSNFWGVTDEALELATADATQPVQFEKTGDYTYTATITLGDSSCIYDVSSLDGGYAGIGVQEWGSSMSDITITDVTCYDASGNVVISFDGSGNVDSGSAETAADDTAADAADATADTTATTDSTKGSPDTGVEGVAAVAGVAVVAAGAVVLSKKRK